MAGIHVIKNFWRPLVPVLDAGGETTGEEPADHLLVSVERFAGSGEGMTIALPFADYAGLEAEFTAGSATTVLLAALDTALAALDWPAATKTSAQRALVDSEITVS